MWLLYQLIDAQYLKRPLPHKWHSVNIKFISNNTIFLNFLSILVIVSRSPSWVLFPPPILYNYCSFFFSILPYRIPFISYLHIHSRGESFSSLTSSQTSFEVQTISPIPYCIIPLDYIISTSNSVCLQRNSSAPLLKL